MNVLQNRTFSEISIGDEEYIRKRLTVEDIELFAIMSGDVNPAHLDEKYARTTPFHGVIAHGMWGGALLSAVLGTRLPGPGTIYLAQTLNFHRPIHLGDEVTFRVRVSSKDESTNELLLTCECTNENEELVITGEARVKAPLTKINTKVPSLPGLRVLDRHLFADLILRTAELPPVPAAVVHPVTEHALKCVESACSTNLIEPVLVGPEAKIRTAAEQASVDISRLKLLDEPHSHAAAARAVALASEGEVGLLVKGSLHTDELLGAILDRSSGMRTDRRISHVYVFDVPTYERLLIITDAAINIAPSLIEKADIVQNAIDFARDIGIADPRVAILSAVETVTPKIPSTMDAASLCKMADRGQIRGGTIDGPLAFDNAISARAARIKGIDSIVSGNADILVAPNLESGNAMAKQLEYLADAKGAGILLGAKVPIVLTSRADDPDTMAVSCALAALLHSQKAT